MPFWMKKLCTAGYFWFFSHKSVSAGASYAGVYRHAVYFLSARYRQTFAVVFKQINCDQFYGTAHIYPDDSFQPCKHANRRGWPCKHRKSQKSKFRFYHH